MPGETISPEHAASLVKSGMWLDYGATLCEPDVFDKALAARKDELENIKIRSCLSMRPRAVIEEDPEGRHFHLFSWHFSAYERRKHDAGRCNYTPLNLGEVPDEHPELVRFKTKWGAEPKRQYRYYAREANDEIVGAPKVITHTVAFLRRCWQRLPLGVTAQLGDLIYSRL